jgi:hypothetical protein
MRDWDEHSLQDPVAPGEDPRRRARVAVLQEPRASPDRRARGLPAQRRRGDLHAGIVRSLAVLYAESQRFGLRAGRSPGGGSSLAS